MRGLHYDILETLLVNFQYLEDASRKMIVNMWPILLRRISVFEEDWETYSLKYVPFSLQRIFIITFEALNPVS